MNENKVVAIGFVDVSRGDLLGSQQAIINLGRVNLPVQKDGYWLAKTLGKVSKVMKHELGVAQKESNRLLGELGTDITDNDGNKTGQKGIAQTDVETMSKYADAMEAFNTQMVAIAGCRRVPLSTLEAAGVALPLADQAALHWLLQE